MARYLLCTLILLSVSANLSAQHDPHRNAVRQVAARRFEKAAQTLKRAKEGDPETEYVLCLSHLRQGKVDLAVAHAKKALDAGLPFDRLVAGPRRAMQPLYKTAAYKGWLKKYKPSPLLHGPMLGRLGPTSVAVWLRTRQAAEVEVRVLAAGKPIARSKVVKTSKSADFTAVVPIQGLTANTTYQYQILIDRVMVKPPNARFTTYARQGSAARFNVCFGGGGGYVPKWERMWDTIARHNPAALLMLGDNVYIDDPTHPLTNRYCYYRRQSRPEWRRLTATTSVFAIYDDHDFGLNDCVPGPEIENPTWKRRVWNLFRRNWVNPAYGGGRQQPGCWFDFYIGNVHFILLDGRYYRTRKPKRKRSMLGPVQNAWLRKTVKESRGVFKVIASPVPWSAGVKPGSQDTWDGFKAEREAIFGFLEKQQIGGVFLISADRHRTDLRVTKREKGYDLFEFESSKLTNRHTHRVVKTPGLKWGYNKTCSFGLMRFDTTSKDPSVQFDAVTIDGKRVHTYRLRRSQLGR